MTEATDTFWTNPTHNPSWVQEAEDWVSQNGSSDLKKAVSVSRMHLFRCRAQYVKERIAKELPFLKEWRVVDTDSRKKVRDEDSFVNDSEIEGAVLRWDSKAKRAIWVAELWGLRVGRTARTARAARKVQ